MSLIPVLSIGRNCPSAPVFCVTASVFLPLSVTDRLMRVCLSPSAKRRDTVAFFDPLLTIVRPSDLPLPYNAQRIESVIDDLPLPLAPSIRSFSFSPNVIRVFSCERKLFICNRFNNFILYFLCICSRDILNTPRNYRTLPSLILMPL